MTELPRINSQVGSVARAPSDPDFLSRITDHYYNVRLPNECDGNHPLKGRAARPGDVQMRTNDYLCLAPHPDVIEAERAALLHSGHGISVSRAWLSHIKDELSEFEERVAQATGAEAAIVASSGYCANLGVIQAVTRPDVHFYADMKAHVSLWDGFRFSEGPVKAFRHNDVEHARRLIRQNGPGYIVVDSLYSIDGAMCPLEDFATLAEETGSALIVDEIHAVGTFGAQGGGLVAAKGLAHRVHIRTFGLSKAVAMRGGMIVCSARNAEFIRYFARSIVFSTQTLSHEIAGYQAVFDIFAREPWRRDVLHANHAYIKAGLADLGYNVTASKAQIISLEAGDLRDSIRLRDALENRGVFGAIFFPPATPDKRCLIRFTVNCGHTQAELDRVLSVCAEIRDELDVPNWASTRRLGRSGSTQGLAAA